MATPVVFNAVNYSIPAFGDVGYAQGPGNLSSYLIALATGTLQPTGGLFSLTADANFGPNFGLVALYYKTTTANIATAGQIRLAKTDTIDWRNNANGANLPLAINGSDQLTFNGIVISTAAAGGTVNAGTINTLTYYAATGNTVSSLTAITASRALASDSNGLPVASATTAAELAFVNGVTSSIQTQLNTKATDSLVVHLAGSEAITGVKTFSAGAGAITMSGSTIAMGANKITGLANGTVSTDAAAFGQIVGSFVAPTVQKFTTGSGTYTTPTSPRTPVYLRVRMVGGGGGGSGSLASGTAGGGGAGGGSSFGTTLLVSNGGSGGQGGVTNGGAGGAGGTASLGSGPLGVAQNGAGGVGGSQGTGVAAQGGGAGGSSPFGGSAQGAAAGSVGVAAIANSGSGGSGGGSPAAGVSGGGGGSGGYVDAIIFSPLSTYAYAIGAAGAAGSAGIGGQAAGAGGTGFIVVEEFYQ